MLSLDLSSRLLQGHDHERQAACLSSLRAPAAFSSVPIAAITWGNAPLFIIRLAHQDVIAHCHVLYPGILGRVCRCACGNMARTCKPAAVRGDFKA